MAAQQRITHEQAKAYFANVVREFNPVITQVETHNDTVEVDFTIPSWGDNYPCKMVIWCNEHTGELIGEW